MLVGRDRQRAAIDHALAQAAAGRSATLAFTGPPGIGKTALLEYAGQQAEGMMRLTARGIESEAQIPFASLLELLRPALGQLELLSAPQAAALEQAFAVRPGRAQDRFAVGAATLGLLATCAERQPLVLLLDDVQWFDGPSAEALRFALRRLDADPLATIIGVRAGHHSLLDGTEIETIELEGLSHAEARQLRSDLPAATSDHLTVVTGGNPLALLELTPDPEELALAPAHAPVVSARLRDSYLRRAAVLDDDARGSLLLAATSDSGDLQLLGRAAQLLGVEIGSLQAAEAAGLVSLVAGRVEFQHPLVRAAVYSDATLAARRAAHRALAGVLSDTELARRAWHLAAAAVGTDDRASAALEGAARQSLRRSGYTSAAAAFERAARLSDDPTRRASMLVAAAEATWNGGTGERALELLDEARATGAMSTGSRLAGGWLAGRLLINRGPVMQGHALLTEAAELALNELGDADETIAMLTDASTACFLACDLPAFAATAARVTEVLPASASPATRMRAAFVTGVERIIGGDAAAGSDALREAVAIADSHPELFEDPSMLQWLAMSPLFLRESQVGHAHLELAVARARELAAVGSLAMMLGLAARDQAAGDRCRLGEATYREAIALSRESGQRTCLVFALSGLAWLQARQGREQECRANAAEALTLADELGALLHELWSLTALGELELGLGRPREALAHFEHQRRLAEESAIGDVDLWPAPEMVEAQIRLGRERDARTVTDEFRAAAQAKGQPWSIARALRCEALIAAKDDFPALFEEALRQNLQTPDAFELARTHLAYGERLRRARNRVLARVQLRRAQEIFTSLDARPWAERARAELEATGETLRSGEPNTVGELTPQELQIALMLASGRTTRETAAALFLSPKTIEYHLRHVYLKLGIHSREELARVDGLSQEAATENTGGSRVAAVAQVAPASPEPKTSPEVAPK